MIYIWKWLFFDCGPAEVVCVCWSVEDPIVAWGLFLKSQGNRPHSICAIEWQLLWILPKCIDFSQCLVSQWWLNAAFFCSSRMTHAAFCPSFSWSRSFHPFLFFIPSFSLILYDLLLCLVLWIYCTCYVVFSGRTGSYPPHCHVYLCKHYTCHFDLDVYYKFCLCVHTPCALDILYCVWHLCAHLVGVVMHCRGFVAPPPCYPFLFFLPPPTRLLLSHLRPRPPARTQRSFPHHFRTRALLGNLLCLTEAWLCFGIGKTFNLKESIH